MIFRSGFSFLLCSLLLFCGCHHPLYVKEHKGRYYTVAKDIDPDTMLVSMLAPYKNGVDTQMQIVIGHTDIPLTKAQPECTLGNFMADAQLQKARQLDSKVEAAVMNYGGIRLPYLSPGAITRGKVYELMPLDNMLMIVEVPGEILKEFCNHMAKFRGWPVSGLAYKIKDEVALDIMINGRPVNDHIYYKIALSDYVAKGGDNCEFLVPMKKRPTSVFVRDALIEYIILLEEQGKPLHPQIENRVSYVE